MAKAGLKTHSANELQISSSCWVYFATGSKPRGLFSIKEQTITLKRRRKQTVFISGLLRGLIISQGGSQHLGEAQEKILFLELCWCLGLAMCGLFIDSPAECHFAIIWDLLGFNETSKLLDGITGYFLLFAMTP